MKQEFYSNGKLLLSGEYLILKGALSLALPLKLGQKMKIEPVYPSRNKIFWSTMINDHPWFYAVYRHPEIEIISSNEIEKAKFIAQILSFASKINKEVLERLESVSITNFLNFSPEYGLGSSSTLISNIAYFADIDPYQLLWRISNGSGYDIACARAPGPIYYELKDRTPVVSPADFNPHFAENLYFVYLGHKIHSQHSIDTFQNKIELNQNRAREISNITRDIINAQDIIQFEESLILHENIISRVIGKATLKSELFNDYWGCIKSLGAWGGDFILATSTRERSVTENYFKQKGLSLIYSYNELVL